MKHLRQICLTALFCVSSSALAAENTPALDRALTDALTTMRSVYESTYAPTKWKQDQFGWSLDAEYNRALGEIQTRGTALTQQGAREIVKNFIYSMKDYHVSVSFQSTEIAELPFTVRSAEGKLFIVYVNTDRLGSTIFPFAVGDELVLFDGKPAMEVVKSVQAEMTENVPGTDQAQAEINLTRRRGSRGFRVPQGPVMVGVKKKGSDTVENRQLIWEYKPELISGYRPTPGGNKTERSAVAKLVNKQMSFDDRDFAAPENLHGLGAKKSFLPPLGAKIWEAEASDLFEAYITMTAERKLIGVIRIPSYVPADAVKALASFSKIMAKMETMTDGLVIDQLNNPGGSVFYLYSLVSMLSDQPMKTPLHSMSITPADVLESLNALEELRGVRDDATAREIIGETIGGYPVDYQVAQFYKSYAQFLVSEWDAGRTMSRPYWIAGVDTINPNPTRYTKPILILVNELDFSGGDFFPAIMQDNGRAKILGTRTSGAGGYVVDMSFPNLVGIASCRITQSLAKRVTDNPIENLGVTPDFIVPMRAADLSDGYKVYTKTVLDTILGMTR